MENNSCMILDVQGFKLENNKFIPKELAAYDGNRICHYIFKPPFGIGCLSPGTLKQTKWLMENHHCIDWSVGFTPLYKFASIISDLTKNKTTTIYVKGREKAEFLRKYSTQPITELEEKPTIKKSPPRCLYHLNNVNYCVCALSNVYFLYDYIIMT